MSHEDIRQQLLRFGFSDKEVDVYFVTLRHGEATAKEISDDSDVSIRYVYDVGERLAARGLVRLNDHASPTTIRALQPTEAVDDLRNKLETLEDGLAALYSATEPKTAQFDVIKSQQTVVKRIRTLIGSASDEVILSVPAPVLSTVRAELVDAVDRDVLVLLLVTGDDMRGTEIMYDRLDRAASAARVWAENVPLMLSVDTTSGVVGPSGILRNAGDEEAVAVTQNQLVSSIAGSFLSNYWPMAEEVSVTDPVDLPRTFDHFRHAVLHATLHKRADTSLQARVVTRGEDTGDTSGTVEGEVVDVRQALVLPPTNSFPIENSLVVRTNGEEVSVGGDGSFIEEYEAREVTLTDGGR